MEIAPFNNSVKRFQRMEDAFITVQDEAILYAFLDKEGKINYAITHENQLVGLVYFNNDYNTFHIANLYILQRFRNLGLGKMFLDLIKSKNKGQLITCCPYTEESAKFFIREGFVPEGGNYEEYYYLKFQS